MANGFPNDENGDVLRRMQANGDNLAKPRNIDFTVVFPDQPSAEKFSAEIHHLGCGISIELTNTRPELPWDVVVAKYMSPSHEGITQFEAELETIASRFGGSNDGWGCFNQK